MTISARVAAQELALVREDLHQLVLKVASMGQRMNRLEAWQHTMDMTLKSSFEPN